MTDFVLALRDGPGPAFYFRGCFVAGFAFKRCLVSIVVAFYKPILTNSSRGPTPYRPREWAGKFGLRMNCFRLRRGVLAAIVLLLITQSSAHADIAFSDIKYWVGTGSNRAGFVVDWMDGKTPQSLAWGYRWDSSAAPTGEDMLKAIVNSDSRLFAAIRVFSFGDALVGFGYDLNDNATFSTNPNIPFDANGLVVSTNGYGDSVPTEAGDHWQDPSGGFWSYWNSVAAQSPTWAFADSGMSDRILTNNVWDGWSLDADFNADAVPPNAAVAAVPEPSTFGIAAVGLGAALLRRRRQRAGIGDPVARSSSTRSTACLTSGSIVFAIAATTLTVSLAPAAVSVTVVDYTPGTQSPSSLNTAAYKDTTASKVQDQGRDTGGSSTQRFAVSLSNGNFADTTIIPVGQGGGISLKFQTPINALDSKKEFGIFVGNFLTSSGGFFYGDMRGSILVSQDNLNWRTLSGQGVPSTDVTTIYSLNAPSAGYQYTTGQQSWQYGTGSTRVSTSTLEALGLADYEVQMPDDSMFDDPTDSGAAGKRASLVGGTDNTYKNVYGTSAGGNWFDLSNTGWQTIQYVRLNVASNATVSVRLDSVFANAAAVPEPAMMTLTSFTGVALSRRRMRSR